MKIKLSPVRGDVPLILSKAGDTLTLNGDTLDFSALPTGATLPKAAITNDWIAGDVERDGTGELIVPVVLPHGYYAPVETRFPGDLEDVQDGDVTLPVFDNPPVQEEPA